MDLLQYNGEHHWIAQTLQDMDPSRLQTLNLVLKVSDAEELDDIPWERIEALLLDPSFKSFKKLVFSVPPTGYHGPALDEVPMMTVDDLEEAIAVRLPTLMNRQVIAVQPSTQTRTSWNDLFS